MTLNFVELTQKMRAGETAGEKDLLDILNAGPGATFALVEVAAEYRRTYFHNTLEVTNLVGEGGRQAPSTPANGGAVRVGAGETPEELAHSISALAADSSVPRISIDFVVPGGEDTSAADSLTPMYCLRVLAACRLAAPAKSLRVIAGREAHMRSLQSLAFHLIDSTFLSDYRELGPRAVFEDLKMIDGAGLSVLGAEHRNLVEDYISYLEGQGVADASVYAGEVFSAEGSGGCGGAGGCGCGSGGCGSRSVEDVEKSPAAGCGGGCCS